MICHNSVVQTWGRERVRPAASHHTSRLQRAEMPNHGSERCQLPSTDNKNKVATTSQDRLSKKGLCSGLLPLTVL